MRGVAGWLESLWEWAFPSRRIELSRGPAADEVIVDEVWPPRLDAEQVRREMERGPTVRRSEWHGEWR